MSNAIQSGGTFGSWLDHLGKKALKNVAISFAGDNLSGFVNNINSNARAGNTFSLILLNKAVNIIKMKKILEDSKA